MTRIAAGLLLVLAATTTAVAADREHEQLMADIRMLHEQSMRLHLAFNGIVEAIETLAANQQELESAMRRAFADQRLVIDNVGSNTRVLREKLDETNVRISSLSQEVEALRVSIPPMPVQTTQLPEDAETAQPDSAASAPAAPVVAGGSPQRLYNTAWADYASGQWALAVTGFEAYISTYPRSEMTDDAAFYVGETYFLQGDFQGAVEAYEQVVMNYPNGDKVPEAAYKRGVAFDRLGEPDRARESFELVVTNYPDSRMAALAQQLLDRLSQ
ncbi:MAG: tol-pal system protein YbgF [Acidobacteria bacterium]|nr:tol-pal system protein YbgF [Acidobacteriota bacterium]